MTTAAVFSPFLERHAVKKYDPNAKMSRDEIKKLLEIAQQAPSAWNLQPWTFLVIDEPEAKQKLLPIAFGQQQVVDASMTVAVLGDLEAQRNAESVYQPAVASGMMTAEVKDRLVGQIESAYANPQTARDQAFLNAALPAMQLMLAAKSMGYDSCPMGGFDATKLSEAFRIPDRYIPIMLIAVGKATHPAYPSTRFEVDAVTKWNTF
ncbi:nitroreductase family protein [Paenibacillus flagellatus]|uniref:Nitroreductase family protein n=1 Tax=Paenibacillus flagellatus TaxID=2211139 RepID=A0A2V5K071_9BACL|nr:nitroreductase family protein [Paenibacillus flagellatus]PYI51024.1 nitroreductase family protein [Paenibacillus flagellatus]